MPYSKVTSGWVGGDLYFYDKNGNEIFHIDGTNRALVLNAAAALTSPSLVLAANIANGTITAAKLANGAGLAAVIAAGLGTSVSYVKTDVGTKTLLAANATKDRGVLVVVIIDESYATAGGTQPTVKIGEAGTLEKGIAAATIASKAAGTVLCAGFLNTSTNAILATVTAAVGAATGGCSIAVIALPNS